MSNSNKSNIAPHVPGDIEKAASKVYFERGSQLLVENISFKKITTGLLITNILMAIALVVLLPLKTVETVKVSQDKNDRLHVVDDQNGQSGTKAIADESVQLAWVADWTKDVFEINAATWVRNFKRAISRTTGTAKDQLQDYWHVETNNPTRILTKDRDFVREVERLSINTIQPNVILIRFRLISRAADGTKSTKIYATTVTLKSVPGKSREEIIDNPSGLLAQSISISDETK